MQLFQNIKNFVARVVQAFSSLKNWLFGSNEPIQNEEEEREEQRSHLIPWVSPSLVKLCAIGITSKTALGLQSTCRMPILFPKKDDENGPPGSSFTWTTSTLPSQDDTISTNTAACAA